MNYLNQSRSTDTKVDYRKVTPAALTMTWDLDSPNRRTSPLPTMNFNSAKSMRPQRKRLWRKNDMNVFSKGKQTKWMRRSRRSCNRSDVLRTRGKAHSPRHLRRPGVLPPKGNSSSMNQNPRWYSSNPRRSQEALQGVTPRLGTRSSPMPRSKPRFTKRQANKTWRTSAQETRFFNRRW